MDFIYSIDDKGKKPSLKTRREFHSVAKTLLKLEGKDSLPAIFVMLANGEVLFFDSLDKFYLRFSYFTIILPKEVVAMPCFFRTYKVRFEDCDPAGIVFYPNYILMLHRFFEDWCGEGLGFSLATLHGQHHLGFPIVKLNVLFKKPSRLEEVLEWSLQVRKVGAKSLTLDIGVGCGGEDRLAIEKTVVCVDLYGGNVISLAIPADIRTAVKEFLC